MHREVHRAASNRCRAVSRARGQQVLTNRKTVVSPGICDAEGGRADRCMSRVRECGRLMVLMRYPVTVLCLRSREVTLQHGNAAAGRVDVGRDAQRTNAESPRFPGRTHRSADRHHARRVHADGDEEVLSRVLRRSRSHRVLDYQRVDIERPRHDCAAVEVTVPCARRWQFLI